MSLDEKFTLLKHSANELKDNKPQIGPMKTLPNTANNSDMILL